MSLLALLDEIRAVSRNGLFHADDPHDEERFRRILELVCEGYGRALDRPPEEVRDRLYAELGHVTPSVSAGAAVFDDAGRVLLTKRADDGTWCLPGGYVDPGEDPAETAVREVREETGLEITTTELVDTYALPADERHNPHAHVAITYLGEVEGGAARTAAESQQVEYRAAESIGRWHPHHETYVEDARRAQNSSA